MRLFGLRGPREAGSGFKADDLREVNPRTTSCGKSSDVEGLSTPRVLGASAVAVAPYILYTSPLLFPFFYFFSFLSSSPITPDAAAHSEWDYTIQSVLLALAVGAIGPA